MNAQGLTEALTTSLAQALRGLRYGTIQLVVHDARIVRIERIERIRLPAAPFEEMAGTAQAGLTDPSEAATTTQDSPTHAREE